MKLTLSFTGRLALAFLLLSSVLAGCSAFAPAQPTPVPTVDQSTLIAAAVQTLAAQMTEEALRNPTATNTPEPTATATFVPTATPVPATPTPAASPTATNTQPPAVSAQALYASTYPEYKVEYVPNEKFGLALGFKNTGSVAWTPGYRLKLVGFEGEITCQTELELSKAVAPGEKIEFNLWAFGSETLGRHIWYFQLYTPSGGAVPGGAISYSYTSK